MQKVAALDVCSKLRCTAFKLLEEEEGIVAPVWNGGVACCVVLVG